MMARRRKEHWTRRIKRENRELKAQVERLRANRKSAADSGDLSELREVVQADVKECSTSEVMDIFFRTPVLNQSRSSAFIMETGESVRSQPVHFTDSVSYVVREETFDVIIRETSVDQIQWHSEMGDCDDIARHFANVCRMKLKINSVGVVFAWSGGHCFNIAIVRDNDSDNLKYVFLEPQSDRKIEVGEGMYNIENALIVF